MSHLMRKPWLLMVLGVLLGLASPLTAVDVTVGQDGIVTVVVQNDDRGYNFAEDTANGDRFGFGKVGNCRWIRFPRLGELLGRQGVQVVGAELDLFYTDEWWTNKVYHVTAAAHLEKPADPAKATPDSELIIYGDKVRGKATKLNTWQTFKLNAATVQKWIEDEKTNQGITVCLQEVGYVGDERQPETLIRFAGVRSLKAKDRPKLVIRYKVTGNVPPFMPALTPVPAGWRFSDTVDITWTKPIDINKDALSYEFQAGRDVDGKRVWEKADARVDGTTAEWAVGSDFKKFFGDAAADGQLYYRVRAVDPKGAASPWNETGPVGLTDRPWTVWALHGNHKIWPDVPVEAKQGQGAKIQAARNEWEPLQVIVATHNTMRGVTVEAGELSDGQGHVVKAPTVYIERYLPIAETPNKWGRTGPVPDALAPVINPVTGKPTAGLYGQGDGNIAAGRNQGYWLDYFVDKDVPPGTYKGTVTVRATNAAVPVVLPVQLEVFNFTLASPKHLVGTFEMGSGGIMRMHTYVDRTQGKPDAVKLRRDLVKRYEEMLHEHDINNWSPLTGWNYTLNGVKVDVVDGKVQVDWKQFDDTVGPYMDGSAYKDKVPAQWLFVPYWVPAMKVDKSGFASRVNRYNYQNIDADLLGQYLREVEKHFKEKGWLNRAYYFVVDEPFIQKWKYEAFLKIAKIARKEAPDLRIFITDVHRDPKTLPKHVTEPLDPYVDVWDPVTLQLMFGGNPMDYYIERKKQGHFDIWCQTLLSAAHWRPWFNLYPEFDMPFHRVWAWTSWYYGLQGLEFWDTVCPNKDPWTDPAAFKSNKPLNCDGRLFYPGTPTAIGGDVDIPIASMRLKSLRESIEDYEYIWMLAQTSPDKAQEMVEKLYTRDPEKSKTMVKPMSLGPGADGHGAKVAQWWEGDPDRQLEVREQVARLIEAAKK